MMRCSGILTLLASLLAAGCVTINIYFPASAAEKAADTIIDEVWKLQGRPVETEPKEKAP
jgi:uncharacterized protein